MYIYITNNKLKKQNKTKENKTFNFILFETLCL